MSGSELGLMEMSEVDYSHLQYLIQAQMEAQATPPNGPDAQPHPATITLPFTSTHAIDLSTSTDEHCLVVSGEKTPASCGEVPGFVLARVRGEDNPPEPRAPQKPPRSAARVCLEKRFNAAAAETLRQHDIQSAVLSNFLILQQSAEAQEAVMHPQKWMKNDRSNPFEASGPFVGSVFNPVTSVCEQVISHIPHMVDPKHQTLIIPKSFSLNFCPERVVTKAQFTSGNGPTEEQQLVNTENGVVTSATDSGKYGTARSSRPMKAAKDAPDSAGETGSSTRKRAHSHMSVSQRRELHNSKERERRKMIRLCCDELNMLVPFCEPDSDKVTTLQWTTAFLRYMNKTYGDTFKEEFKREFMDDKGLILKSSSSSGHNPSQQDADATLCIPLAVEQ